MSTLLNRAHRGLFAAVVGLLCLSYLSPAAATLAYGDQVPGDSAVISSSDGSGAALRETVGYDAAVLSTIDDQTPLSILEGPIAASSDGSLWYLVSVWDLVGYVDAADIASASSEEETSSEDVTTEEATEEEAEAPSEVLPWQDPIDYGVVVNNIQDGSFPESGLACRGAANEDAVDTYRFQVGETIEITGEEFWEGDFAWYPVNCAGVGGFTKSLYVQVADDEVPVEETEEVVVEEPTELVTEEVTEEVVTEEVTEEVITEEATEEVATEEVVTEEVTEEVATEVSTEEGATEPATETSVEVGSTETATSTTSPAVELPAAIGSAEVQGTNGDGLVCRVSPEADAAVIVVLAEGTVVDVTEQTSTDWLQIVCANQLGYANTEFLWSGGATDDEDSEFEAAVNGSAKVSGTNGTGVRCRTSGSTSASIITTLSEGTTVTTRGAASGGWVPVVCAGTNGFISATYLTIGGGSSTPAPGSGNATVSGTNGTGVRCRTSASTSGSIITVLSEGTSVATRGAASNGWTPVTCSGQAGFISSQYLTGGGGGGTTPTPTQAPGGTSGSAKVSGTNGDGVRCRTSASTSGSIITVLSEGTTVTTRGAASGGWTPVTCGGQSGYVSSQYLTVGGGGTNPTPTPTQTPGTGALKANDHAKATSTLNLRYSASMSGIRDPTSPREWHIGCDYLL